jgi:hypothetical protein
LPRGIDPLMDAKRPALPFVLTANDLLSGYTVYHDGAHWVAKLGDALVAKDAEAGDRLNELGLAELSRGAIVDPYLAGVTIGDDGAIAPRHFRDAYRLSGPTIAFAGPAFVPGEQ